MGYFLEDWELSDVFFGIGCCCGAFYHLSGTDQSQVRCTFHLKSFDKLTNWLVMQSQGMGYC